MPGFPEGVYAFWVGMPPETQLAILERCALCSSVDTLAVFRCTNWTHDEHGNVTAMPAIVCNEYAPLYNAIKRIIASGVCGAAQIAFIHACGWQFRRTSTT